MQGWEVLAHWGVRTWDHRDTATRQCDGTPGMAKGPHLQLRLEHAGEAGDGEGGHAVRRLLTQAQLTQQLPHHRRQLEPVACRGTGVWGHRHPHSPDQLWGARGGVLLPTRKAGSDDDVAELGVPVQDEIFIRSVLWESQCEGVGPGVLFWT